jgi:hypothetical protein
MGYALVAVFSGIFPPDRRQNEAPVHAQPGLSATT